MDAMRHPAPVLRLCFAIFLFLRFFVAVISRAVREYAGEQRPLLEPGGLRDFLMGFGGTPKQSILASIDWTILVMLTSSIVSVIFWPGQMAVVRLRSDVHGYMNWRDHYIRRMTVQVSP